MNRRDALIAGGMMVGTTLLNADTHKDGKTAMTLHQAYGTSHRIHPLPFDPKGLQGISENVIRSHHKNNYSGAVKKLRLIQEQIAALPETAHPIELGALKKEELIALNSKLLHELYFENLGGDGKVPSTCITLLEQGFGSYERWQKDFIKTAKSLSGGSGWVMLSYVPEAGVLINQIAGDHTDSVATGRPLLVMDMYEHAYHMDYGTQAARYIDAFMANIHWGAVMARWKKIA